MDIDNNIYFSQNKKAVRTTYYNLNKSQQKHHKKYIYIIVASRGFFYR